MSIFIRNLIIFLIINFAALGIGVFLMGEGPTGDYYQTINKAPWTPPGWVFGAAWTLIMICFSFYMASWTDSESDKTVLALFAVQFILNVGWNPLFFNLHMVLPALIVIIALTILIGFFLFNNWSLLGTKSLLIAPYFIWLCIATSLNWYILTNN
jgi:tryptophan-rich sensory protein